MRASPLRYSNIRAGSQRRLDLSTNKTFRVSEGLRLVFRAGTCNARNAVVFRAPNTGPVKTAFGRVTSQEPARSWQFSLAARY